MEGTEFVYETLGSLLSPSLPSTSDVDGDSFSFSYTVLKNDVSWRETDDHGDDAPSTAAEEDGADLDYFPLQVGSPETSPPPLINSEKKNREEKAEKEPAEFESASIDCNYRRFKSRMLQLHKEIVDFSEFVSPTQEEQASRAAAFSCVFEVVKYIWPHCQVEVFGSFRTGLYLPTSDIDVVILNSNIRTPQMGLHALSRALSQKKLARNIQVIGKARVPIIKFVEKQSSVAFDISFDIRSGPEAANFMKDAVAKLCPLRPLCLILKLFLQQRGLNEVYSGGLGSYALLVMIMAYVQMEMRGEGSYGSHSFVEHNLGILLVKFFEFYGHKLNTDDVGISCNPPGTFFLKSSKGFEKFDRPHLISIEDPQEPENDIGKNSFNYYLVKSAFAMAYSSLTNTRTLAMVGPQNSILGLIIRPDPTLLTRKAGLNNELTFNAVLPGAGTPMEKKRHEDDVPCNWQADGSDEDFQRSHKGDSITHYRKRSTKKTEKKKRKTKESPDDLWGVLQQTSRGSRRKSIHKRRKEEGSVKSRRRKNRSLDREIGEGRVKKRARKKGSGSWQKDTSRDKQGSRAGYWVPY